MKIIVATGRTLQQLRSAIPPKKGNTRVSPIPEMVDGKTDLGNLKQGFPVVVFPYASRVIIGSHHIITTNIGGQ